MCPRVCFVFCSPLLVSPMRYEFFALIMLTTSVKKRNITYPFLLPDDVRGQKHGIKQKRVICIGTFMITGCRRIYKPSFDANNVMLLLTKYKCYIRQIVITDLAFTSTLYVPAKTFINSGFPCLAAQWSTVCQRHKNYQLLFCKGQITNTYILLMKSFTATASRHENYKKYISDWANNKQVFCGNSKKEQKRFSICGKLSTRREKEMLFNKPFLTT